MQIAFWNMHGAGNAFVVLDDRRNLFPLADEALVRRLCHEHPGCGSDGLILLQTSQLANGRMRFFNPDGRPARMCGNGARCAVRLLHELDKADRHITLETDSGLITAEILDTEVRLALPPPTNYQLNQTIEVAGKRLIMHLIDTGVPHAVFETADLESINPRIEGPPIRYHSVFAPQGTNVNWLSCTGPHAISVRTYERGVEGETAACGTGITASALIAAGLNRVQPPVRALSRYGDILTVDFQPAPNGFGSVSLRGPAVFTGRGQLSL